jgi:predicted nucleic acid-binding protein
MTVIIDANVFLEAALDQERGNESRLFLEQVRDGKVIAAITDFHVDSILLILESHGKSWIEMVNFIASLFRYKGLSIYSPGLVGRLRAAKFMGEHGLDFDDALLVQTLVDLTGQTVVSYDSHLDGVDGILRKTPGDLLK